MTAKIGRTILATVMALGVAACGSPPAEESAADAPAAAGETVAAAAPAADAKPAAFAQCAACHAVEPGKHGVGPSLHGVYGTKSGAIPGYAFSDAMKAANLTWDDATLDTFLAAPMKTVPGTRMAYAGQPDPAKRKELIEYIKSLK